MTWIRLKNCILIRYNYLSYISPNSDFIILKATLFLLYVFLCSYLLFQIHLSHTHSSFPGCSLPKMPTAASSVLLLPYFPDWCGSCAPAQSQLAPLASCQVWHLWYCSHPPVHPLSFWLVRLLCTCSHPSITLHPDWCGTCVSALASTIFLRLAAINTLALHSTDGRQCSECFVCYELTRTYQPSPALVCFFCCPIISNCTVQ